METICEDWNAALAQAAPREAGEQLRLLREIEAIASELDLPAGEIAEFYARMYADLKARAQVTDYLPVLVARKVRARFRMDRALT
jgi:hypothetical protein